MIWLTAFPGNEGPSSRELIGYRNSEKAPSRPASSLASGSQTPIDRGLATAPAPAPALDLATELGKMIENVVDMVVLSKKRDSAQRDFEEAEKAWDKTKTMESNFPASVERLKADFTRTKLVRDNLDRKIQKAKSSISTTGIADCLSSLVRSQPQSQASLVEDRLLKSEEKYEMLSQAFEGLKQDRNADTKRVDNLHKDAKSTMGQASKSLNTLKQLKDETRANKQFVEDEIRANKQLVIDQTIALKEKTSRVDSQQAALQQAFRQQQEKINRISEENVNLLQKVEVLEAKLAYTITTNQVRDSRLQAVEEGQDKIPILDGDLLVLSKDIKELANNFNEFDEDVGGRVRALESRNAPAVSTTSIGTDIEAAQTQIPLSKASDQLRQSLNLSTSMFYALGKIPARISALVATQEAFEAAQGEILESHEGTITKHGELLQNQTEQMQKQAETLQNLLDLTKNLGNHDEILQKHDHILAGLSEESKLSTPMAQVLSPNVLPKTLTDTDQHAIQMSIAQIKSIKSRIEGTEIALSGLNARMNNIHTEHLGRQIIGQLASAYPNLPTVDDSLTQLADWQTRHEPIISQCVQRLNDLFQTCESMGKLGQDSSTITKLQNLENVVEGLKASVESSVKKLEGQVESIEHLVGSEGNTVQEEFQGLKASVETSVKELEDQVQSIEHLIEYDDNETMKEKIKHIFTFIKLFQQEFATMTERYKKVMAWIDSHHDSISSIASSTSRSVSAQSLGKKRTASSSPSVSGSGGPAVNGSGRPPKKRKEARGFLDVDDDE
jgi:chromosome segregation ATPase